MSPSSEDTPSRNPSPTSARDAALPPASQLGLVLTGGGARGAYQVGVIRALGQHFPELRFPIISGVSAGAINAAFLAAHPGLLPEAARDLTRMWENVELDDVADIDTWCLLRNALRWFSRLAFGRRLGGEVRGFLATDPLRRLLERALGGPGEIKGIARNLDSGKLEAIALATVNYATGRTINWIQGDDCKGWEHPWRRSCDARLTVDHVMASSALPLLFPAIELDGSWYGDGGIRLAAPLSPALHLGADRLLAVSTRYQRSLAEAERPSFRGYPPPAQIAGQLLNSVFLDVLDQDVRRLRRKNDLVRRLPVAERQGLRLVKISVIRPSEDLGRLAARYEPRLPRGFRFLTRNTGTRETESPDSLSLLMFQPEYLCRLIAIGERDTETHLPELRALIETPPGESDA